MARSPTIGPDPAWSVCTWVSATLNGAVTLTLGAAVSVEPETATFPVLPASVHSGVPAPCGAAVGHPLVVAGGSAGADLASVSEPHATSVTTNEAAQAASATDGYTREEFTVATLTAAR